MISAVLHDFALFIKEFRELVHQAIEIRAVPGHDTRCPVRIVDSCDVLTRRVYLASDHTIWCVSSCDVLTSCTGLKVLMRELFMYQPKIL